MYYVYVLRSRALDQFYIGSTFKLRVFTNTITVRASIKPGIPWDLVYYKAFLTHNLALKRENKLKHHGKGFAELQKTDWCSVADT